MHRRKLAVATVAVAIAGLLTSGCSAVVDQIDGASHESKAAATKPVISTVHWGVVDGLLSVVVENTSDRTLRYGESVIHALDADGDEVASSLGRGGGACCSLADLAPGQAYGVYLDVGPDATRVTQVQMAYRNLSWAAAGASTEVADIHAAGVRVVQEAAGSVVEATVTSPRPVTQVGVQAFLFDDRGRFLAVVSGRWTCLAAGTSPIRMQLFHDVTTGTEIRSVRVHAVSGDPTQTAPDCGSSAKS